MFCYVVVLAFLAAYVQTAVYTEPVNICSADEFACGDGACVSLDRRCDGIQHCADFSDEEYCGVSSNKLDLHSLILHRHKRQSTCRKSEFPCKDGTCIRFDGKCDGIADCPDGSDETHALCRNMRCQANLFRCTYGACVDGTAACNGMKECVDNSDELLPRCRNEVGEVGGKFTCKNGEKISSTDHCDGVANCSDGSDETIESCAGKRCSSILFQCAYGACVDSGADCDQKVDCVDGSDESAELCNTTTSSIGTTTNGPTGNCVLPDYPAHGTYSVADLPFAQPGQSYNKAFLIVTCDPGYGVVGQETTYCNARNKWTSRMPQCTRFCKLTPHSSVTYRCKLTGEGTSGTRPCNELEPSGTIVNPECNRPNYYHSGVLTNMYCIDGSWDYVAICQPECGTPTSKGDHLIINGTSAKHGELPWHAGIYDKNYSPQMQICGGSLVSTTVIISAAHCFWSDQEGGLQPPSRYAVALGKIYRPWNVERDTGAQKSDVSDIKKPVRFMGEHGHFQDDIALVIMSSPAEYNTFIRPVCIDFDIDFDNNQLKDGNLGKVAGWGLTSEDGDASQVLKTTDLPYVDVEKCIADLPYNFRSYITSDKICAGTMNGTALCHGDSGGGLAFPTVDGRGIQRYYLRGIVSTAPSNGHKCNANSYTSFTHILKHDKFIKDHLNNYS